VNVSALPNPLPPPYALSATDTAAPANNGTCFSRSPGVPANCTENCVYYPEIFGDSWLLFGELVCAGTFPANGSSTTTGGSLQPTNIPGYVTATMTKQCKDYKYVPPWMGVVTDQWGGKWALQTSEKPMATDGDWANNLNTVVWPAGWVYENVTLNTTEIHVSYLMGNDCWSFIIRDSNNNAWHMFVYPENITNSLFANFDCIPFKLSDAAAISNATASAPKPSASSGAVMIAAGWPLTGVAMLTGLLASKLFF